MTFGAFFQNHFGNPPRFRVADIGPVRFYNGENLNQFSGLARFDDLRQPARGQGLFGLTVRSVNGGTRPSRQRTRQQPKQMGSKPYDGFKVRESVFRGRFSILSPWILFENNCDTAQKLEKLSGLLSG